MAVDTILVFLTIRFRALFLGRAINSSPPLSSSGAQLAEKMSWAVGNRVGATEEQSGERTNSLRNLNK